MQKTKLGGRFWLALTVFSLVGQVAWVVEKPASASFSSSSSWVSISYCSIIDKIIACRFCFISLSPKLVSKYLVEIHVTRLYELRGSL